MMISLPAIYWDPDPIVFTLPFFDWPIFWYGVLFTLGFVVGFPLFAAVLNRFLGQEHKKQAFQITDRLTLYMILGTIIGARLGHFLFYEHPSHYLQNPLEIFRTWAGGLASHGAVVGILVALFLFSLRIRSSAPTLTWLSLLDLVSIPTSFAAFCIRIGNFVNQEVLGTPTTLPWAIIFGHPADHSAPIQRHPVQIYEALFYLGVFFLLWRLSFQREFLFGRGKLVGLFLILVFGFRFLVELLKEEQSRLLSTAPLTMGQMLSIPIIIAGILFYQLSAKSKREVH